MPATALLSLTSKCSKVLPCTGNLPPCPQTLTLKGNLIQRLETYFNDWRVFPSNSIQIHETMILDASNPTQAASAIKAQLAVEL